MFAMLAGIPGKMKTLLDRLTSTRAANLDKLDANVSTRAASATALTNAVWTDALATKLNGMGNPESNKVPIAGGLVGGANVNAGHSIPGSPKGVQNFAASTVCGASGTYSDVVNISGSGILTGLFSVSIPGASAPSYTMQLIVDGVTIGTYVNSAATSSNSRVRNLVGGFQYIWDVLNSYETVVMIRDGFGIPFKTSLQIRVTSATADTAKHATYYSYIKTS